MAMKLLKKGRCMCRELPPHSVGLECFKAGGVYDYHYLLRRNKDQDILKYRVFPDPETRSDSSFCAEYETFGPQTFTDFFTMLDAPKEDIPKGSLVSVFKMQPHEVKRMMPPSCVDHHPDEPVSVACLPCRFDKDRMVVYRDRGDAYEILFMSSIQIIFDLRRDENGPEQSSVA